MPVFWLSFGRPGENYVVITEAPTPRDAVLKAAPLKDFAPPEWDLHMFPLGDDDPAHKDFQRDVLITEAELRAKGYMTERELKRRN